MTFTNQQLLDKALAEGVQTDVRVTFATSLLESFMNTFGGYAPEDVGEESELSYQIFHPVMDKVVDWVQDNVGEVTVTTCYTLHDDDGDSYCDIYVDNDYMDGKVVDNRVDYDDTFGDSQLEM